MMYDNYPYSIFNTNYLSSAQQTYQQIVDAQKKHNEQQKNIADMVKAISDYCEAARKIDPEYRQQAMQACWTEILCQMAKDNGGTSF